MVQKKIKLGLDDSEEDVYKKLTSNEINEDGEMEGFPKLKNSGGFELLTCHSAGSRDLTVLNCILSAKEIRMAIGGSQTKIYIRPIQNSLDMKPLTAEKKESTLKEKCRICNLEMPLNELRKHFRSCSKEDQLYRFGDSDEKEEEEDDNIFERSPFPNAREPSYTVATSTPPSNDNNNNVLSTRDYDNVEDLTTDDNTAQTDLVEIQETFNNNPTSEKIKTVISTIKDSQSDEKPIEILRTMQLLLMKGRALEVTNPEVCEEGETNFIIVDRNDILATGFEEIKAIEDLFMTLEVQFYDEVCIMF